VCVDSRTDSGAARGILWRRLTSSIRSFEWAEIHKTLALAEVVQKGMALYTVVDLAVYAPLNCRRGRKNSFPIQRPSAGDVAIISQVARGICTMIA